MSDLNDYQIVKVGDLPVADTLEGLNILGFDSTNNRAVRALMTLLKGLDGKPVELHPQARSFWSPPQETTESALATRWNGQLYAVLGKAADSERWQVRLWWKPFVTLIWYGGLMIALGGLLALIGRVREDLRRRIVQRKAGERRAEAVS